MRKGTAVTIICGSLLGMVAGSVLAGQPPVSSAMVGVSDPIVYRGRLAYLDLPVSTSADVRFRLYREAHGGDPVGSEIELEDVGLDDGWFEAVLDFGVPSELAWIEVDVRSPSGDGAYTTLSPRQPVGARSAHAFAGTFDDAAGTGGGEERGASGRVGADGRAASDANGVETVIDGSGVSAATRTGEAPEASGPRGAGWSMSGSTLFYTGGNVGIGTSTPNAPLHVVGTGSRVMRVINTPTGGSGWGLFAEANGNASRAIFGRANRTVGQNYGVFGQSLSNRGTGVFGQANATAGITFGVSGVSRAGSGTGVRGLATNASGSNVGVLGETRSNNGLAGHFVGGAGVDIDKGTTGTNDPALRLLGGQIYLFEQGGGSNFANIGYIDFGGGDDGLVLTADGDTRLFNFGGGVGIGRAVGSNAFEVEGDASKTSAGLWSSNSDARIKTDVRTITDALDTLDRVRLVSFEYEPGYLAKHPVIRDRRYLNVIAQEFARVFPEHVKGSGEYLADGSEILQVDAYPLTIYSAAAVQELRRVVRTQDKRIEDLEARLLMLERLLLED